VESGKTIVMQKCVIIGKFIGEFSLWVIEEIVGEIVAIIGVFDLVVWGKYILYEHPTSPNKDFPQDTF
jgi:hypothetical protein